MVRNKLITKTLVYCEAETHTSAVVSSYSGGMLPSSGLGDY